MPVVLLALHAAVAAVAPLAARRLGRAVFLLCAVPPAATVAWAAFSATRVLDGEVVVQSLPWLPQVDLALDFVLDPFALLMVGLVSGIGTLIFLYSVSYFAPGDDVGRFAGRLLAFAGAMLGLVLSDNLLVLYVFWELTSITSYLLIGFTDEQPDARDAALQALFITAGGGLAMLGGFVLLGQAGGTYLLSELVAAPPTGSLATAGVLLVLLGAFTKSAQAPFHSWLPRAMAAPTPVSAYLHSATMVKAGVYLVARLAPGFAAAVPVWRPLVLGVGVTTMLVGGARALRQTDLKLLLAYGTVSQLGFLMVLFGAGLSVTTTAAVVLLLAHALFKAALFLVTGVVDHAAHTRDIRRLDGLHRTMPATAAVAAITAASMAGLPPLFGFIAKEEAYTAFVEAGLGAGGVVVLAGLVAGSILTFAYSYRYVHGGFASKPAAVDPAHGHAPRLRFLGPAAFLAVLTVAFGLVPGAAEPTLHAAARALGAEPEGHLALWHGLNLPLLLSAVTIGAGLALVVRRADVERLASAIPRLPSAEGGYRRVIRGLTAAAPRVTGIVQSGSLPTYLAVILATVVLLPLPSLLGVVDRVGDGRPLVVADTATQLVVVVVMVAFSIGIIAVRRRFAAVLMLGGVGYSVATLFVLQGAPDLALTQFLVETLTLVIFVLVLRHMPRYHRRHRWRLGQQMRRTVAAAVGLFVFGFTLVAASTNPDQISERYLQLAPEIAEGNNVVNVILVDFRGYDTFGEITVLSIATLGIAGLVLATRAKEPQRTATRSPGVDPRDVPLDPDATVLPEDVPEPTPSHELPHDGERRASATRRSGSSSAARTGRGG